jgi:hypothetical protein
MGAQETRHSRPILVQHVIDGLERREKQTDGSSPAQPCQHYTGARRTGHRRDRRWKSVLELVKPNHLASSHWAMSIDPSPACHQTEKIAPRAPTVTHKRRKLISF